MTNTTLLDGNVEDVKAGLSGLDATQLAALLAAEKAGKTRKGVLDAIEAAQAGADEAGSDSAAASESGATPADALDKPADISPAAEFDPSGAPHQVDGIDMGHPAVDANPRANTTDLQNRIDFNDPTREGIDVVTERTQPVE